MKAITIAKTCAAMTGAAMALVVVSTPAFAGKARHHKHAGHHHVARAAVPGGASGQGAYSAMVARHAAANGIPASLVHRVIMRESRYNARAVSKGNYGMMQIKLGTARAMGYTGSAAGLLDPETNMTYAVKYLAGAYKAAGGSESGAVSNYARGYYARSRSQARSQVASRRGVTPYAAPGAATFAMQTPVQGYSQQASYQQASYQQVAYQQAGYQQVAYRQRSSRRTARRGMSPYVAPGYAAFAMQPQSPRRSVRGARAGLGTAAVTPMTADRHAVF